MILIAMLSVAGHFAMFIALFDVHSPRYEDDTCPYQESNCQEVLISLFKVLLGCVWS